MDSVAVILLAAGSSRRMGKENKLLLSYGDRPMIQHQVVELQRSKLKNITVVVGHEAEQINAVLPPSVKTVFNKNHLNGMTSSIQAGILAAGEKVKGYMICLSDMPLITAKEYDEIADFFLKNIVGNPKLIVQPVYKAQRGHPVIFASHYRSKILEHTAPEGCRDIIRRNRENVRRVNMLTEHILKDIDTLNDYRQIN